MPKHIKRENSNRFKIIPTGKAYKLQEKKSFLGWNFWKTLNSYSEFASSPYYFRTVEEAKLFIDNLIKEEEFIENNLKKEEIYYP